MNSNPGFRHRILSMALAAMLILGMGAPLESASAKFLFFKFTPIADTGGLFFTTVGVFPAINNNGRIAFRGTLTGGVEGMFTRVGTGGINTLADTGLGEFRFFGIAPSINTPGTVLFSSQFKPEPAEVVLLRGSGNSSTPLIDTSGPFRQLRGFQINDAGTAVFGAVRNDGRSAVVTKGSGAHAIVAEQDQQFSSVDFSPSINNGGTVSFAATRSNGTRGIFVRNGSGPIFTVLDDSGPFAGFAATDINDQGTIAFVGSLDTGIRGVFRVSGGSTTTIADASGPLTNEFGGFSLNNAGTVAWQGRFESGANAVFVGPNSFFGRVVGTGDVLFGRAVVGALIDRDALNDQGQLAVQIGFANGTSMVARVDPVVPPIFDLVVATAALQMTTGSGTGTGVSRPITNPRARVDLSFDVTFLTDVGNLEVRLDDTVLKAIPAADIGTRTTVQIPLDFRSIYKERAQPETVALTFALNGKPGFTAQIDNVVIPGLLAEEIEADGLAGWTMDSSKGGTSTVIDTSRFPVQIDVQPGKSPNVVNLDAGAVSVAILSSAVLDAAEEIDRATIRFARAPLRTTRDKKGAEQPVCEKRDTNGDRLADLVCEVQASKLSTSSGEATLALEATTTSGLRVAGSDSAQIVRKNKPPAISAAPD